MCQLALYASTAVIEVFQERKLRHSYHLVQVELTDKGCNLQKYCQILYSASMKLQKAGLTFECRKKRERIASPNVGESEYLV